MFEIKTSMLFNLDFDNNTVFIVFLFLFLIIDFYFLIPEAIIQIFNFIAGAKSKDEIHPAVIEVKLKKQSVQYNLDLDSLLVIFTHQFVLHHFVK